MLPNSTEGHRDKNESTSKSNPRNRNTSLPIKKAILTFKLSKRSKKY